MIIINYLITRNRFILLSFPFFVKNLSLSERNKRKSKRHWRVAWVAILSILAITVLMDYQPWNKWSNDKNKGSQLK